MMRVSGFLLGLLILPAVARAQTAGSGAPFSSFSTGTIPVEILRLDGAIYDDNQKKGINNDQCKRDVQIVFQLRRLDLAPSGSNYIQLWVGGNCQNPDNRDQVGEADCDRVPVPDDSWQISDVMQDFATTVKLLCDIGEGPLNLFFLPTPNTTDASGTIQSFGAYALTIDKSAPDAPENVNAGSGETAISISWDADPTDDVFNNYLIWDKNPTGGLTAGDDGGASVEGACGSSVLKEGDEISLADLENNRNIETKEIPGKVDNTTVSGDELGAQRVAMAVVAGDLAGNLSKLSNVDCLQVVATDGFWDAYKNAGGEAETGCGCSIPGARTSRASGLVPIALFVLAWGIRRRTRKRSGS